MTRQSLIRRRADILRRSLLLASITVGAAMWALTILRVAGFDLVMMPRLDVVWDTFAQAF